MRHKEQVLGDHDEVLGHVSQLSDSGALAAALLDGLEERFAHHFQRYEVARGNQSPEHVLV